MGLRGHPQSNCSGGVCGGAGTGGGLRKKVKMKKIWMVAVVILVGVMGVMVVQKVKERRMFNLAVKDKDRQILSLHLLLQKERQYAKDSKRKNQDLNAKLSILRTQKIELDNKISEMKSTISSMRDEQRALELTIEEKQNEIKHKDFEINNLRNRLQISPKIWSVSTDDPSNPKVNLTDKATSIRVGPSMERSLWLGQNSKYQEIINPNIDVANPSDENLGKVEFKSDVKNEKQNATNGDANAEENGDGLSTRGRRFFIGTREGKSGQIEKSQLKGNREEGLTESKKYTTHEVNRTVDMGSKKTEVDRIDEDDLEAEADTKVSMESSHGSEVDQDYKEDQETDE